MKRTLIVMLKEPRPGRVKTRLGRDIGMTAAAWWFRHQTRKLLRDIQNPRWQTVLAVAPDISGLSSCIWPQHLMRIPQGQGDLGTRMRRAMHCATHGPVCVIGADIPNVKAAHIARAFQSLGGHDAVFGPAHDGGYWLVGVHNAAQIPVGLFKNVRWSTQYTLADTMASIAPARIALADTLRDVDTVADLAMTRGDARDS